MPRFRVMKKYETIVTAETMEEAERLANDEFFNDPSSCLDDWSTEQLSNQVGQFEILDEFKRLGITAEFVDERQRNALHTWIDFGAIVRDEQEEILGRAFTLFENLDDGENPSKGWFLMTLEREQIAEFGDLPLNELMTQILASVAKYELTFEK